MLKKSALVFGFLVLLVAGAIATLYWIGAGGPGHRWEEGTALDRPLDQATLDARRRAQAAAAASLGVVSPRAEQSAGQPSRARQILFGDLHVHTTFSLDAFAMALPLAGGSGARPVSDACDFARYCSQVDFWSVNDHAIGLTPWKWEQTIDAVRQCEAIAGDSEDVVPFLGWEWTQVGAVPENHYGHKNVVLRGLAEEEIPDRPIAAASLRPLAESDSSRVLAGLLGAFKPQQDIFDLLKVFDETTQHEDCPLGVPVREQASGCRDAVPTPAELFTRLDDWGFDSIVVPHGTTWGMYTPPGASWDKQLAGSMHDPNRQTLVEVFSGHGNSEEYRSWREVVLDSNGDASCPAPTANYLPSCWRAGELIHERCTSAGEAPEECTRRAAEARQNHVAAGLAGNVTVPATDSVDWLDAGQCSDCFQPSFNYRPKSSAQYMMALRNFDDPEQPRRFDFGFIASSDNHSARPGTGYKEYGRLEMTEARLAYLDLALGNRQDASKEKAAESVPYRSKPGAALSPFEADAERAGSFFGTGGLVAVHAKGRGRDAIWDAMQRKEVYGTSGPRILLWFDLLNPPGSGGGLVPMGGEVELADAPIFRVRAAGSFEQKPGCGEESASALGPERLQHLCGGECFHPSDVRRPIERIEVVRIRPQNRPDEPITPLIDDAWRVFECDAAADGCSVTFADSEFPSEQRDTLYYVRAIEASSPAVGGDALGCSRDAQGRCTAIDACRDRPTDDDCLAPVGERAWSSPIFVGYRG